MPDRPGGRGDPLCRAGRVGRFAAVGLLNTAIGYGAFFVLSSP